MATITEEVRTLFTANTTGLVDGVDRAQRRVNELRRSFDQRSGAVRGGLLDPASLAPIIGGKLAGAFKLSAVGAGAAAAAAIVLAKAYQAGSKFAGEQAGKMNSLAEEMRATSAINVFSTSAEGADALGEKFKGIADQIRAGKAGMIENDPFGFGGGIVGNMKTVIGNAQLALQSAVGVGTYTNFDQQEDARKQLEGSLAVKGQEGAKTQRQREEASERELQATRERLTLDQQTVTITDLLVQKELALSRAKSRGATSTVLTNVTKQYDEQIEAQKQLRAATEDRYQTQVEITDLTVTSQTAEQQAYSATRMRAEQLQRELGIRQSINTEEMRSLTLAKNAEENSLRVVQRLAVMQTGGQINAMLRANQARERRNKQADRRLEQNDGLTNVQRGINGEIESGTDIVTGEKRGPSAEYLSNQKNRAGLSSGGLVAASMATGRMTDAAKKLAGMPAGGGGLVTGGLMSSSESRDAEAKKKETAAALKKVPGTNDQSAGRTALDAARATVQAINITNAYMKAAVELLGNMSFA